MELSELSWDIIASFWKYLIAFDEVNFFFSQNASLTSIKENNKSKKTSGNKVRVIETAKAKSADL